jgi:hypothetical protein
MAKPSVRLGLRVVAGLTAVTLLLVPSILMLIAWTEVNMVIAVAAILALIAIARHLPNWKWFAAVVTSVLLAIPPYPYWLFGSNDRGWYLHFFSGFDMGTLPLARFAGVFVVAIALCGLLLWSVAPRSSAAHDA